MPGPILDFLTEFAIRYCTVIFFGQRLADGALVENPIAGTATLLEIGSRRFIVTNDHVLEEFEKLLKVACEGAHFQVGRVPISPFKRLIARDARLDICTFAADDIQPEEITDRLSVDPVPPLEFFRAVTWPAPTPEQGDPLIWAGFPSSLRHFENDIRWTVPMTFVGPAVTRVDDDRIICNDDPDRRGWQIHYGTLTPNSAQLRELGGMSGGPVFLDRKGMLRPELVGLISEYHPNYNSMRISRLDTMRADGTLQRHWSPSSKDNNPKYRALPFRGQLIQSSRAIVQTS